MIRQLYRQMVVVLVLFSWVCGGGIVLAADDEPRQIWHLELRNLGGGVEYRYPYSPVCFSPDSKFIAVSLSNRPSVWERSSKAESVVCADVPESSGIGIWEVETLEFKKWIKAGARKVIRYSPDGKSIAALDDGNLLSWDVSTGEETVVELIESPSAFDRLQHGFAWLPNDRVAVLERDGVAIYSTDGVRGDSFPRDKTVDVVTLESSVGRQSIVADSNFWNVKSGEQAKFPRNLIWYSIFRPGTKEIWCRAGRRNGAIAVWNPPSNQLTYPITEGLKRNKDAEQDSGQYRVEGLAFHPAGKVLASVGYDSCIHLWNAENGQRLATLELAKGPRPGRRDEGAGRPTLKVVQFSPDGRWLMACSVETVSIFKIASLKPHIKPDHIHRVTQYFAGTELKEEVVTNPRGAYTIVGSKLHTEPLSAGDRVIALMPDGNDDTWFDAVVLARATAFSSKPGVSYTVHYEGYSREDDALLHESRVRPKLNHKLKITESEKDE